MPVLYGVVQRLVNSACPLVDDLEQHALPSVKVELILTIHQDHNHLSDPPLPGLPDLIFPSHLLDTIESHLMVILLNQNH